MKKFITFGGPTPRFHNNVKRICKEAHDFEYFNEITGYTEKDLISDTDFWCKHGNFISSNPRGFGYWIWKSYFINRELEKMKDGDILVYADSGCKMNKNGKPRFLEYIDMLNNDPNDYGIISFQLSFKEHQYTKKAIFDYLETFVDKKSVANQQQCMATSILIKKTKHSSQLIKLWSNITQNYPLINDVISKNEDERFVENRHDQSIYSVIVNIFGSIKIKDETYFENPEESVNYPILALRL